MSASSSSARSVSALRTGFALGAFLPLLVACGGAEEGGGGAGAGSRPTSQAASRPSASGAEFAQAIEEAHGGSLYAREVLHADLQVQFGGGSMFDGSMVFEPSSGRCRLVDKAGGVAVFDGKQGWAKDMATAEGMPPPRFHLLTWSWFLSAPWKLQDPGSKLGDRRQRQLRDRPLDSARLTYEAGVGDTPDDWYVVYAGEDSRLAGVAYIVTFGTSVEAAAREPHAALYEEVQEVNGLVLPKTVTFWNWTEEAGVTGEAIGRMAVSNVRFGKSSEADFSVPKGAKPAEMPR